MGPEAPDCMGQIEATAPKPCSGARRRRHRVGLQSQDKSGTGGSQAAGPGPPSQPHVQDKLLPMQGTRAPRWHSRGARAAGVWQWGHCATRCAPGWGCSPEIPQGLRQSKLTFPQHPRPKPLSKALCPAHAGGVQGQVGSRAASPLLLRTGAGPKPQHPNLPPEPGPRCSRGTGSGFPRENPAHAGPWHRHRQDNFRGRAGASPGPAPAPTAPHGLGGFVPSRLILAARSAKHFRTHVASDVSTTIQLNLRDTQTPKIPAGDGPGCSRKAELPRQTSELWVN